MSSAVGKLGIIEDLEYHHPDRLGTKLVSDPVGSTFKEQATLPFGTSIDSETSGVSGSGSSGTGARSNQRFTSYDRSEDTGLDYAVNRTYNSGQSRFTTVDPIGMASANIGDPQSLNLFAYVTNNPVDFVDPEGLQAASPMHYVCWDVSQTGEERHPVLEKGVDMYAGTTRTTTECHFFGGGNSLSIGGGGGDFAIVGLFGSDFGFAFVTDNKTEGGNNQTESVPLLAPSDCDYYESLPRVKNAERLVGQKPVRERKDLNTECVALVKIFGNAPPTRQWRGGSRVLGNQSLKPGTLIATFEWNNNTKEFVYPNKSSGNHAAIYLGQAKDGIWVIEQWAGIARIQKRNIRDRGGSVSPSNDARMFREIMKCEKSSG